MKKIAAVLVVVLFTSSYALGSVVSFTQTSADPYGNSGDGPTTATFDTYVDSTTLTAGRLMGITAHLGSDSGLDVSFVLDGHFTLMGEPILSWNPGLSVLDPGTGGVYVDEVTIDGFDMNDPSQWEALPPVLLGVMTVDADGLAPGLYSYGMSGAMAGTVMGERDPIEFSGLVNVIPEPATLSLLALGMVGLIRRRMAA